MDPFAVAGNSAAAIYPEFGATQIPEGIAVYIYIIAVGQFHTSHTAIINIVVDDLDVLAAVCFHAQGAAAEKAAIFHQNILAVHKEQHTTQAVPRFLCMTYSEALDYDIGAIKEIQHIGISGHGRDDINGVIITGTTDG